MADSTSNATTPPVTDAVTTVNPQITDASSIWARASRSRASARAGSGRPAP